MPQLLLAADLIICCIAYYHQQIHEEYTALPGIAQQCQVLCILDGLLMTTVTPDRVEYNYVCSRFEGMRRAMAVYIVLEMAKAETLKRIEAISVISINGLSVTYMSVYNVYIGSEYIKRLII